MLIHQKILIKPKYNKLTKSIHMVEPQIEKKLPDPTEEDFAKLDFRVGEITECWKVFFPKNRN
jgi:hypothetical protein